MFEILFNVVVFQPSRISNRTSVHQTHTHTHTHTYDNIYCYPDGGTCCAGSQLRQRSAVGVTFVVDRFILYILRRPVAGYIKCDLKICKIYTKMYKNRNYLWNILGLRYISNSWPSMWTCCFKVECGKEYFEARSFGVTVMLPFTEQEMASNVNLNVFKCYKLYL